MRNRKTILRHSGAAIVGLIVLAYLSGCVDTRGGSTQQEASEESLQGKPDTVNEAKKDNDALRTVPLQEIVQAEDDHFWVVNLDPTDGDYYFGDLAKESEKGWYGSYGGEYVTVELDEIRYLNDTVRFVMKTFGSRPHDDGTVVQTDPSYYTVDITRVEIVEAIEAFRAGDTDVVLLEAQAVPVTASQ